VTILLFGVRRRDDLTGNARFQKVRTEWEAAT
jgi:hypothetical protein